MISSLPDWLPKEAWEGYVAMRKQLKKPLTARAEKMAIAKLLELKEQGQDVEKVLEQSEFNCWQGLFPVHQEAEKTVAAPFKPKVVPDNWWLSDAGIERKGRELGMYARPGESYGSFKNRIFAVLNASTGTA